jgi:hypothetical protein
MIDLSSYLKAVEAWSLASRIRQSLYLFPFTEASHVIGLALVFGTILVIDLRLLGVASAHRPLKRMESDILKWTWGAFALTALTGGLMFITNAQVYYHNFYFRMKMVLLVLAGVNLLVFELTTASRMRRADASAAPPIAGKAAAVLSLVLWVSIIFMGRLIGFTTTRVAVPMTAPAGVNFDDFLNNATPPAPGK